MAVLCFLSSGGGFTFHREIVCPCLPVDKREWTHPFWKLDIPLEMFYKTKDPFTLLPHCIFLSIQPFDFSSSLLLSLWSIKETDIRAPIRWLFWGANLPSFQPSSSLIKVSSLPQHLPLDSLAYPAASRVSLDSVQDLQKNSWKDVWRGSVIFGCISVSNGNQKQKHSTASLFPQNGF